MVKKRDPVVKKRPNSKVRLMKPALQMFFGLSVGLVIGCSGQDEEPYAPDPATTESTASNTQPAAAPQNSEDVVAMLRGEEMPAEGNQLPPGHPPLARHQPRNPHAGMGLPAPSAASVELTFTAPDDWVVEKPKNAMRRYQYRLPGSSEDESAEAVVFFLGARSGSTDANINRWIGQFSKAEGGPLDADDVTRSELKAGDLPLTMVEFAGTYAVSPMMGGAGGSYENYRLIAGIIQAKGSNWFIKTTGPSDTLLAHREKIIAFMQSATITGS